MGNTSHAATQMWRKWDAKVVDEDLRVLAANGFRILRVFPNWADFQPIVACYLNGARWNEINDTRMFLSEEPLPDTPCGRAGVDENFFRLVFWPLLGVNSTNPGLFLGGAAFTFRKRNYRQIIHLAQYAEVARMFPSAPRFVILSA